MNSQKCFANLHHVMIVAAKGMNFLLLIILVSGLMSTRDQYRYAAFIDLFTYLVTLIVLQWPRLKVVTALALLANIFHLHEGVRVVIDVVAHHTGYLEEMLLIGVLPPLINTCLLSFQLWRGAKRIEYSHDLNVPPGKIEPLSSTPSSMGSRARNETAAKWINIAYLGIVGWWLTAAFFDEMISREEMGRAGIEGMVGFFVPNILALAALIWSRPKTLTMIAWLANCVALMGVVGVFALSLAIPSLDMGDSKLLFILAPGLLITALPNIVNSWVLGVKLFSQPAQKPQSSIPTRDIS